jgi:peptide/nickel transport system substrate-binding protein
MINRRNFTQSVPAGIAGLLLAQWGIDANAAAEQVRIAYPIDVPSWDPSKSAAPNPTALFKCVFDQPLEYTPDSKLQPGVVKAYEWLDKEGLVLQVDLRDDVFFHNGDKLTSEDFKFTFFDRLRAEKGLQLSFIWGGITAIETPSPTRAVIRFGKPMVTAPQFLGYSAAFILPKAYYEKVGLDGFLAKPVGSGPYKLVDYQRDSSITLEAFDRYWRGPAKIRKIVFQVVKDPTTRVSAVQSGQVQLAAALPMREALRLGQSPAWPTASRPRSTPTSCRWSTAGRWSTGMCASRCITRSTSRPSPRPSSTASRRRSRLRRRPEPRPMPPTTPSPSTRPARRRC